MADITPTVLDRALGALVGLAIGDALGTSLEGFARSSHGTVREMAGEGAHHLEPGQWTDDTAMALCLADSLIAKHGRTAPHDIMARFARWMTDGENSCTGTAFDIGWTIKGSISEYLTTGNPVTGPAGRDGAGNGGIMRLAPAVLANLENESAAAAAAVQQTQLTHGAPQCLEAADLLARMLHRMIHAERTPHPPEIVSGQRYHEAEIAAIARSAYGSKTREEIHSTGYVVHTLEAALWAFSGHSGFEGAVTEAVNLGGDADTVGAVAGQIAGAAYGLSGIPARWLDKLA